MLVLGIDIGGTSIKGAAVNDEGKTYESFVMPVDKEKKQEETIQDLTKEIKNYLKTHSFDEKIAGIGIGVPGTIDAVNGVVIASNNLKWYNLPLRKMIAEAFDMPVKITNDANAAAYGEACFGAGKKYKNVIMITLGTGVGGGVIIDGKIFEGSDGTGAEMGHSVIVYDGEQCSCGRKGCLEAYASATALIRQTKRVIELHPESLIAEEAKEAGRISGRTAFNALRKGDKFAEEVIDQYCHYLATGIMDFSNIFRPDCFVLSGGIANEGQSLIDRLVAICEEQNYGFPNSKKAVIKIAELGYQSGIIGAACLLLKDN